MKARFFIFSVLITVLLSSCAFFSDDPDYENKLFNPSAARLEKTNIPVLQINTADGEAVDSKEVWKDASFALTGSNCGFEDLTISEIKIKGRGNSTWEQPKQPYSIKLSEKESVLGMPKSKRWVLIANYSDKTLLRNCYASYLGNNIYNSTWAPSFQSVHLIVNGAYRGVYQLGEQIKIDDKRVNIKDITKADTLEKGGFIVEIDQRQDEDFNFITSHGVYISLKDPDEVGSEIQERVRTVLQSAEDRLYSDNFADAENGWRKLIDENSIIDWYIINEFTKNCDAIFYSSVYIYYNPKDKKLHFGPIWDFDLSCGNVNYNECEEPEDFWVKNATWFVRLFEDSVFVANVKARWNSTKDSLYDSINTWIQAEAEALKPAANMNFQKWEVLGKYVWPNAAGSIKRTTYQSEIDYMVDWLNTRFDYMNTSYNQ